MVNATRVPLSRLSFVLYSLTLFSRFFSLSFLWLASPSRSSSGISAPPARDT